MSSFVISKINYIRAAAFLSAAAEHQNYYGEPVLSLWNQRTCRRYTSDDIRADFERLYEINARAVAEQYHDATPETDDDDYMTGFNRTKNHAKQLLSRGYTFDREQERKTLQRTVYSLIHFLNSAQYQIEGADHTRRALRIMNKYYRGLYDLLRKLDGFTAEELQPFWGSFFIEE